MSNSYKEYASKEYVDSKTPPIATTEADGLMSAADKSKLDGIAAGAKVNVQADWNVNDETSDAYVQNRPFYITEPQEVVLYEETIPANKNDITIPFALVEGKSYTVIYDGITYSNLICYQDADELRINIDVCYIYCYLPDCSAIYVQDSTKSHTIKILTVDRAYVQLDEKYISYKPGYVVPNMYGAEIFNTKDNIATGNLSHAEGGYTQALGNESHAEGDSTIASGFTSHTEGCFTSASGDYSHAEGEETIAAGNHQHVQGKCNIEDTADKYAHIVGNGSLSNRSNAHTLDWNGVAWFKSNVKVGGTGQDDTTAKTLATTDVATAASDGLMSSTDKAKVDTVPASIADTTYTAARYRASALVATETDPTVNGVINWTYE